MSDDAQPTRHSPDECGRECQYYDYFEMLWDWFADESRNGAEDMRANMPEGLSADDFKAMLDEHEAAILNEPQAVPDVRKISDEDMRELLSAKDVGTGRARLKRFLSALSRPKQP